MKAFLRKYGIPLAALPALVLCVLFVSDNKRAALVSTVFAVLACVPFFLSFERGKSSSKKLMIVAVMTALSVLGRFVFAPLPAFKPVTALVVITAMYLGSRAGFMTGALSAVLSDFYFGQGPWTPFQMLSWGLIGFAAGIAAPALKKSRVLLALYGIAAGAVFSLIMDVWTVVWYDGSFKPGLMLAAVTASLPFTAIYAVSNALFLLLLAKPVGKKLDRLTLKYGI